MDEQGQRDGSTFVEMVTRTMCERSRDTYLHKPCNTVFVSEQAYCPLCRGGEAGEFLCSLGVTAFKMIHLLLEQRQGDRTSAGPISTDA